MKLFRLTECLLGLAAVCATAPAQESSNGFELRATAAGEAIIAPALTGAPRNGSIVDGGFRAVLYPVWKITSHWSITGAIQVRSRPYYREDFTTPGHGVTADVLQAQLVYSRIGENKSFTFRAGQLSSAFGSFLLRYDDAKNPLPDQPLAYGYYYQPVTIFGLAGAETDITFHRLDARAQFVNSSPANPRSLFDKEQYGSWAGGLGWTIRQGLRLGVSAYRGPYLDRHYAFYFPGEADPKQVPATGLGIDGQWSVGHWDFQGELQKFQMTYKAIPDYNVNMGYMEAKRALHPRWYAATRVEYLHSNYAHEKLGEFAVGFRPAPNQILKVGYEIAGNGTTLGHSAIFQYVTTFQALSLPH